MYVEGGGGGGGTLRGGTLGGGGGTLDVAYVEGVRWRGGGGGSTLGGGGGVCWGGGGVWDLDTGRPLKNRSNLARKTVQKSPQEMSGF